MTIAVECTTDLTTKIQTVAELNKKTFSVYSEEDLLDKTKLVKYPCVGVMYEGIQANSSDPSRQGMSADLSVALALVIDGKSIAAIDQKQEAARLLDLMRQAIRLTKSPTKHPWAFVSESQVGLIGNVLVYVQRWRTMIPLT